MEEKKGEIVEEVERLAPKILEVSRAVHSFAEPGFQEHKSAEYLASELAAQDFIVQKPVAELETAFRADYRRIEGGASVAFCAEYDAIPGVGHGCAHNLISASAFGAAVALKKTMAKLPGNAVVMGTPAEEGGAGKAIMLDRGAWRGIDAAMEIHGHPIGHITVSKTCNALQGFEIAFSGRGPREGKPHYDEVNALDAANLFIAAINMLRERIGSEARIQYIVRRGGDSCDSIPLAALLEVWVRGGTEVYLEELLEKVKICASGAASALGAGVEFGNFSPRFKPILQNLALEAAVRKNVEQLGLSYKPTELSADIIRYFAERSHHGPHQTDFGNVSQAMPAAHIKVGLGHRFAFHTPEAARVAISKEAHERLIDGAKILALTAYDLLARPELMEECKKEFESYKSGAASPPSWHLESW